MVSTVTSQQEASGFGQGLFCVVFPMLVQRQAFVGQVGCDYKMSLGLNVTKVVCIVSCNELPISSRFTLPLD